MKISIAGRQSADKINQLRLSAYTNASNAKIRDNSFLYWNEEDDSALVLYIENEAGQAISSMRARVMNDLHGVENKFDIKIGFPLELPALILDRASTTMQFRGLRLSAIFRHLLIKACLNSEVKNILTTINAGALRTPVMESIGYRFREADISLRTESVFENDTKVLIGNIHHSLFDKAVIKSKQVLKYDLEGFEIQDGLMLHLNRYMNESSLLVGSK